MNDQTPASDYVPQPRGSGAGTLLAVIAAVLLMVLLCGGVLLFLGVFAYRTVEVQQPAPMIMPQPAPNLQQPIPPFPPETAPDAPVQETSEPANP